MDKITDGIMVIGQRVSGTSEGTSGKRSWTATWSGEYVGSWMDEGELYNYFRNGEINGVPQKCFGHRAADCPDAEPMIVKVGTLVDMGGPTLSRVTEDGAIITEETSFRTPCTGPGLECTNSAHDHFTNDPDDNRTADGARLCNDCSAPCHWDEGEEDYFHDDPNAPACFLIH